MITRLIESTLSLLFPLEVISRDGKPYLKRWHVKHGADGRKTYIHHVLQSDNDKSPHDHPWGFKTRILWGGYDDEIYKWPWNPWLGGRVRVLEAVEALKVGGLYIREAEHLHRLRLKPGKTAWTWVETGPKVRDWGFVTEWGAFIPQEQYKGQ